VSGDAAVRFFQALGDGTRLELLQHLRGGERTVGELVDALRCPQPKVSRHLKVLKEAGLVEGRRDGRHVTYALTGRRSWDPAAREWLAVLDAGFPPGAAPETRPAAVRARRAHPVREPRPAASVPAAPRTPAPPRRRDMETHLL
jgi:DNA-binding transcriptional ArsR family regulator